MIGTEQFEGQKLISVLNETTFDESEIITATEESFGLIHSYLVDFLKISKADIGNPVSYFDYIDTATKEAKFHSLSDHRIGQTRRRNGTDFNSCSHSIDLYPQRKLFHHYQDHQ